MANVQNAMHELEKLIESREYGSLAAFLDDLELQMGGANKVPDWPYAVHMLGFLINNDRDNARYLYKRAPPEAQLEEETTAVWNITVGLWTQNYQLVHSTLNKHSMWTSTTRPVVRHLKDVIQARMIALVSRAYTTISTADAANFLGLSTADTIQMVLGMGWEVQSDNKMLTVKACAAAETRLTSSRQLQQLTEYVVHLEG